MTKIIYSIFAIVIAILLIIPTSTQAAHMTSHDIGVHVPGIMYGYDHMDEMSAFLEDTETRFVRDVFDVSIFKGSSAESWFNRAEEVLDEYELNDITTMGVLTNTKDPQFSDINTWRSDVRSVATRFQGRVTYWQVGLLPEQIGTADHYGEVLRVASEEIRSIDSDAQIVTGGLSYASASVQPNSDSDYIDILLSRYRDYADIWGFAVYSCDFYVQGKKWAMENGVTRTTSLIKGHITDAKFMVNEVGCLVDSTYTENIQASYLQDSISYFTAHPDFERIIIHNSIDQGTDTVGITEDFVNYKRAGEWYRDEIPPTPYDEPALPLDELQAGALELRQELEGTYFGQGLIPVAAGNWNKLVFARFYGGYSVKDIAYSIVYGGKTVHPTIPWVAWKETDTYQYWINIDPFIR